MKVFAVPAAVPVPDFMDAFVDGRFSLDKDRAQRARFLAELTAHLQATGWKGKLTGEVVRFPMADSYAEYMVAHAPGGQPSMALIHLPLGDAWHITAAHARGLRQQDIRELVDGERRLAAFLADKKGA